MGRPTTTVVCAAALALGACGRGEVPFVPGLRLGMGLDAAREAAAKAGASCDHAGPGDPDEVICTYPLGRNLHWFYVSYSGGGARVEKVEYILDAAGAQAAAETVNGYFGTGLRGRCDEGNLDREGEAVSVCFSPSEGTAKVTVYPAAG